MGFDVTFFLEMSIACDYTEQLKIQLSFLEIVLLNGNAVKIRLHIFSIHKMKYYKCLNCFGN